MRTRVTAEGYGGSKNTVHMLELQSSKTPENTYISSHFCMQFYSSRGMGIRKAGGESLSMKRGRGDWVQKQFRLPTCLG